MIKLIAYICLVAEPEDGCLGELCLDCQLTLVLCGQEPAPSLEEGDLWLLPGINVGHMHKPLHPHLLANFGNPLRSSDVHILKGVVPGFPGPTQLKKEIHR